MPAINARISTIVVQLKLQGPNTNYLVTFEWIFITLVINQISNASHKYMKIHLFSSLLTSTETLFLILSFEPAKISIFLVLLFLSYCLKTSEQQWGGSLFLTTKSPGVPGTHLIDLRRIKGWINLAATLWNKEIHCLYNIQKMHFLSLFLKMSHINLIMSVSYHICCNFTCLFSTFTDLIF